MRVGVYLSLRHNRSMDQYGNPGPYQDPKMREWWDALEVEQQDND